MKNTMARDEVFIQLKQLTHIWESREMITSELYEGEERNKYLKSLACLIISLLYSKIENGQMNDIETLKMIYLGPQNIEENRELILKKLYDVASFFHDFVCTLYFLLCVIHNHNLAGILFMHGTLT